MHVGDCYISRGTFYLNIPPIIQIRWKFHLVFIKVVMRWSIRKFAHGRTAVLSLQVKPFVAIWLINQIIAEYTRFILRKATPGTYIPISRTYSLKEIMKGINNYKMIYICKYSTHFLFNGVFPNRQWYAHIILENKVWFVIYTETAVNHWY